jgi:hypothetical protein
MEREIVLTYTDWRELVDRMASLSEWAVYGASLVDNPHALESVKAQIVDLNALCGAVTDDNARREFRALAGVS